MCALRKTGSPPEGGPAFAWTGVLAAGAFSGPSAVFAALRLRGLVSAGEAEAGLVITTALAALASAVFLLPRWRRAARDTATAIASAMPFLPWAVALGLAVLFAVGSGAPALAAVAAFLVPVTGISLDRVAREGSLRPQLGLLAIYLVLAVVADLALGRLLLPYMSHQRIYAEHHPLLGWTLRPGLSLVRKDTGCRETVNSLGFRTPETPFEKPAGVRRILFLGDSHTEAYMVSDGETYTRLIDAALGPTVETISLGVGGYSTDQELLAYQEYGRRFSPDLVVLQVCKNDIPFNGRDAYWRGKKPRFVRYGERLLLEGVPVPDHTNSGLIPGWLRDHSNIAACLEGQLRSFSVGNVEKKPADLEENWHVTRLLMRDLRALVESDGARLLAFNVNSYVEEFDAALRDVLASEGIPCLDLSAAYAEDFDTLWVGGHWNAEGQRRAAAVLAPQLAAALAEMPAEAPPPEASDTFPESRLR